MTKRTRLTEDEFLSQMDTFYEAIGGTKVYTELQLDMLYQRIKGIDLRFKNVLATVAMSHTSLPPINKIYEKCLPVIDLIERDEAEFERKKMLESNTEKCVWCDNGGTVNFKHKESGYTGAMRCFCPFGDRLSKQIPLFDPSKYKYDKVIVHKHDFRGAYEYYEQCGYEHSDLMKEYYRTGVRPNYTLSDIMESIRTGELKESKKKGDK